MAAAPQIFHGYYVIKLRLALGLFDLIHDLMGDIDILLRCDFKIEKLSVKLATFHK